MVGRLRPAHIPRQALYSNDRSEKDLDWVFDVNLKGTFLCIKEYHKYQKKNNKGNIINIASIYGVISPDPRLYDKGANSMPPPFS